MKNLILLILGTAFSISSYSQNTFPANGNVGIGTSAPDQKLTIKGGGIGFDYISTDKMLYSPIDGVLEWMTHNSAGEHAFAVSHQGTKAVYLNTNGISYINGGNVGIGTTTPQQKFVVSSNGAEGFEIYLDQPVGTVGLQSYNRATSAYSKMQFDASSFYFGLGGVGIGTSNPTEKLSVNGKIRAKEIKVENTNWPDYVFTQDYKLPSLKETERQIKEQGHLPGIPSAKEVKSNGIDLGEINAKLLQKIEELTLYLIELNKTVNKQQEEISKLKAK